MSRETIRVEPLSTYLERYKAPAAVMTRHGNTLYVSGLPPFDPATGEIVKAPIERQTELVLEQLKLCMETAGSSLDNILMCTVYCTAVAMFPAVNGVYAKFFPKNSTRPHVRDCPRASRAVRYRDHLCRLGLTRFPFASPSSCRRCSPCSHIAPRMPCPIRAQRPPLCA